MSKGQLILICPKSVGYESVQYETHKLDGQREKIEN